MTTFKKDVAEIEGLLKQHPTWTAKPEYVARMRQQNKFTSGIDIAKYTSSVMRKDMAEYDKDNSKYTQSLGLWHGFIAQQKMISIKKHFGTVKGKYLYLSGWMVAALRSEFGPLPDQSMHEKTAVSKLIDEMYTFLKQADARELGGLYAELDAAIEAKDVAAEKAVTLKLDNFETHVVPVVADIDAGFGNEEATYLFAKKMIEAGACALQLENQVSDAKQCGHQGGKVTVPHEDFIAKVNACRYAFLELGVTDGIVIARTDSLDAGLTQKFAVSYADGDLGAQYNAFIDSVEVKSVDDVSESDVLIKQNGKLVKPCRLPNGLYKFKPNTGFDRVVLDCVNALKCGADLLWIETDKPHVKAIGAMMSKIREQVPSAKLVYNNSPSFNWTLNFRQQVFDAWTEEKKDMSAYDRKELMNVKYDTTPLGVEADDKIRNFQKDASAHAGVFHHLITLPTYHTTALSVDNLAAEYFGSEGMLGYVKGVQRKEIHQKIACVKHQNMAGSDIGDAHKEYFSGDAALKAGTKENTMNQFH